MKIDTDLRMAINAAARAQKEPSYDEHEKATAKAVEDLTKKNPAVKRAAAKTWKLSAQRDKLQAELSKVNHAICATLEPFGLELDEPYKKPKRIHMRGRDKDVDLFKAAGGAMPPPERRKWSADEVIKRLIGAEPKQRDAILKEYGINWS